jgi:hypothetical protein
VLLSGISCRNSKEFGEKDNSKVKKEEDEVKNGLINSEDNIKKKAQQHECIW